MGEWGVKEINKQSIKEAYMYEEDKGKEEGVCEDKGGGARGWCL